MHLCKEINGEAVAYVDLWIAYENAEIANIAVKKEFLHQGIAKVRLMQFFLQERSNRVNVRKFHFRSSRFKYEDAIKLYEKFGFLGQSVKERNTMLMEKMHI